MKLRASRCSVCGRDVRGLPDARSEGSRWYCSQAHLLESASVGRSSSWKPRHKWRRRIGWTLGVLVALVVALTVIGAFVGDDNSNARRGKVAVKRKPIPVGRTAPIGNGWRMKVVLVTRNATRLVHQTDPSADTPAPGGQFFMVRLAAKYVGGGKSLFGSTDVPSEIDRIHAIGKHRAVYDLASGLNGCSAYNVHLPRPDLQANGSDVFSGRTVAGNVCFEVASNEARSLRLYVDRPSGEGTPITFALR